MSGENESERERETERAREKERESARKRVSKCVCVWERERERGLNNKLKSFHFACDHIKKLYKIKILHKRDGRENSGKFS